MPSAEVSRVLIGILQKGEKKERENQRLPTLKGEERDRKHTKMNLIYSKWVILAN